MIYVLQREQWHPKANQVSRWRRDSGCGTSCLISISCNMKASCHNVVIWERLFVLYHKINPLANLGASRSDEKCNIWKQKWTIDLLRFSERLFHLRNGNERSHPQLGGFPDINFSARVHDA